MMSMEDAVKSAVNTMGVVFWDTQSVILINFFF